MNNYMSIRFYTVLVFFIFISGCTDVYQNVKSQSADFAALYGESKPKQRLLNKDEVLAKDAISYHQEIKPLLDTRCVACHACYDAPCQLKLGSTAGVDRGATKQLVYDGGRSTAASPTRLFIDASNTEEWRTKEFYPVLNERIETAQAALNNSLLAKLIELKRSNPLPEIGKLVDSFDISLDREQECPTVAEFSEYKQKHPDWGMPYAMPGLSLKQEYTLMSWLQQGAKFDAPPALSAEGIKSVAQWEEFFNRPSLKQQLVSRYIYEHLFVGNIHFKGHSETEFYRLVRSETPSPQPVKEIATILPYDDPKLSQFYYRLRSVEETIVEKTHSVYELSADKMRRYDELFFQPDYRVSKLPSYQVEVAANPMIAFADIPYQMRYQFLLDDAQFFVSGFIKGPVCRGQMALGAIRDRFWVAFLNPWGNTRKRAKVADPFNAFITQQAANLSLPGVAGNKLGFWGFKKYDVLAEQYLKNKDEMANQVITQFGSLQMEDIWDGGGVNKNAALTVFRHFDSATVVTGLVGDTPLTAWLVDYPIFERIHYLLVAGFDIYSSINHQLAARKYMDVFRIDGENNFLRFMPNDQRNKIHDSWYKGITGKLISYVNTPYYSAGFETGVHYQTTDYKNEFFDQLRKRLGKAAGDKDILNQCEQEACRSKSIASLQQDVDMQIQQLVQLKGRELDLLPEMALLRIRTAKGKQDLVYTLLLNKSLKNVSVFIAEDARRERDLDTLTVVPGFLGSYPNFFFDVQQAELPEFISAIQQARSTDEIDAFYKQFGIRRTNPEIWAHVDWFNAQHKEYRGINAGLFDLNRYHNL